jgi:hypothetical protein
VVAPTPAPHKPDVVPPPDECTGRPRIAVDFLQAPDIATIFVDYSFQDAEDLGTVYIFNDMLFNDTDAGITQVPNSFSTGSCTRTQNNATLGVGGGICHFVYTLTDSDGNFATFTSDGEVFDGDGGILPITGGAQAFTGSSGELQILPYSGQFDVNENLIGVLELWDGDFWEADVYRVRAELVTDACL